MTPGTALPSSYIQSRAKRMGYGKLKKKSFLCPEEVQKNCGLMLLWYACLGIAIKMPPMAEVLSM